MTDHELPGKAGGVLLGSTSPDPSSTLTAAAVTAVLDSETERIVSGLVLPYGPVGHTSVGPVRVAGPGRVRIPEDFTRVKLMDYHQTPPVAIGHGLAYRETPEGLRASFRVAQTPAGEAALADIRERLRDGLSVELGDIDVAGDELHAGYLLAVALVPIPAWDSARHDGLAAARGDNPTEGTGMTEEQRARLVELLSKNTRTPDEEAEFSQLVTLAATNNAPEDNADTGSGDAAPELAAAHAAAPAAAPAPAAVPTGLGATPPQRGTQRDKRELFAAMARVLSGHSRPELEAALSDITQTANIWVGGTQYDGQLWSGLSYQRRFVPLLNTDKKLTSHKGTGWRWVVKPEVDDYAGDKAAVPSNAPTTEDADWAAARLAGAHDIDRKFWDFGDQEFIAAYYEAMTESYAVQSDDKARLYILALAAANASAGAGTSLFGAAAIAAQAVEDATNGQSPDYFLVNSTDRMDLLELGTFDVPAFLEMFGVTPDKFKAASGVAAGTVVAGTRQAGRFMELGETPIRVEAINIANGGIDGGVFGYYATQTLHPGGVQRATFA